MRKIISVVLSLVLAVGLLAGCGSSQKYIGDLYILNFGGYMSPDAVKLFESETGIRIHEDVCETNEEMEPLILNGSNYDMVCLSDYMIERFVKKGGYLDKLDKTKLTNYNNLIEEKLEFLSACDPNNDYAVPYFCGDMGIIYNKDRLAELGVAEPTKWADLWNPKLKGEVIMQSSIRDLYCLGLIKNGYSMNSTSEKEIEKCTQDFINQKPYVQAYMCDLIKDKMISGECAIAPIVSGDAQTVFQEGSDNYVYVVPEEGTGEFIDAWCILQSSEKKDYAYKFIDFLLRQDAAELNAEYIGYETVNKTTPDDVWLEMKKVEGRYKHLTDNIQPERDIGDAMRYYVDGYNKLKGA